MAKILVADDDQELVTSVKTWLEHNRYIVDTAVDGDEAKEYIRQGDYDAIVLDWSMPGLTGLEVCQWCRLNGVSTPILILTGKDEIQDKVKGLDAGADDYLTKPFSLHELVARIKALMRRGGTIAPRVVSVGPLSIDPDAHKVLVDGKELRLTPTEFSLLEFLARHPGQVFSADALISRNWETSSQISPDTVRVHIKRLREKFAEAGYEGLVENIHGVGYKLTLEK